jgi:hypothetical protein
MDVTSAIVYNGHYGLKANDALEISQISNLT